MFGKLKEKLKSALNVFSKKTEEEAEVKEVIGPSEEIISEAKEKKIELPPVLEEPKPVVEREPEVIKEEKHEKEKIIEETAGGFTVPKDEVLITYFVHGTTTDNENWKSTGWNPGELSKLGIKQAKELGEQVVDKKFEVMFTSDLKRAVDSANLGFKGKCKIVQDKRLRECNYGDLNAADEDKINYLEHIEVPFPHGESNKYVERRVAEFLNYLYEKYKGKHVAILAHKSPQLAIEVLLNQKTWGQAIKEDWRNRKAWQPGWDYVLKEKLIIKEKKREPQLEQKSKEVEEQLDEKKEVKYEKKIKEEQEKTTEEKPKSFFGKLKESLTTKTISAAKFDELFWDLEITLLENNLSVEVIEKIKEDLKAELVDKPLPRDVSKHIAETLKKTLSNILNFDKIDLLKKTNEQKPFVIAFFGINGGGKTTSIAKLAHYLQKNSKSVVLAACDTFRAAAIQQLEEHADKLKVKIIKHDYGSDAAAVAFDAIKYAEKNKIDVVLIDTAGRLHSNTNLMQELKKIIRVTKPQLNIFVGESITGNDCIEQARRFNELVNLDGVILTKADVDEKGGAPLSISYTIKKPILFLGVGQKYDDLVEFDKEMVLGKLGI